MEKQPHSGKDEIEFDVGNYDELIRRIKMVLNNITINEDQISAFCRKYGVKQLALFGSILSEKFRPQSDVDVMVSFLPDHHYSYFDLLDIKDELEDITGRDVDLVEKDSIKNPYRKKSIFNNMQVIYES